MNGSWSDPWCVGGDFNMVRFSGEHCKGGGLTSTMRRFSEVTEELELRAFLCRGVHSLGRVAFWDEKQKGTTLNLEEFEARKEAREAYKKMTNAHRRRNWLAKVKVNDSWYTEENEIKVSVVGTFYNLFSKEVGWKPSVDGLTFKDLVSCEAGASFFGRKEVLSFFGELHEEGGFVKFLNATFLVLVPKKGGVEDLRDFRVISLVGNLYKLLTKVLANRLKKFMGKVIMESQNAFVEGRWIVNAVLIANEAVDLRLKNNEGGVLCKLDIEKVHDRVNWKFLLLMLRKMDFGRRWTKWGDPLSPYLFVIVMEVFSCLLKWAKSGGYLFRWRVRGRGGVGILISHLLFADDTLVFCGMLVENIDDLALELGCKVGGLPSRYLGLPLRAHFKFVAIWDETTSIKVENGLFGEKEGKIRCEESLCDEQSLPLQVELADKWYEDEPRCESFSSLVALFLSKVADVWNPEGEGGGWTPWFSRAFNDWGLETGERFLLKIQATRVHRDVDDMVIWTTLRCGNFSVKSLYSVLELGDPLLFPSSSI
ncbi:hypothetical protein CK203_076857 [Vitis vinifera]|uniref:Reverse transcriptase domain-containing protein n=1 Tax=Vitis vinifera TaxID=29760 RepID=A0A438ET54_VITVI|nr:hypothetical protein CK203_076857 [Vitis vinifera]